MVAIWKRNVRSRSARSPALAEFIVSAAVDSFPFAAKDSDGFSSRRGRCVFRDVPMVGDCKSGGPWSEYARG